MIFQSFSLLTELNPVSVCLRLVLATIFGGIIGMNRGRKRRAAGLRTHMLVCIGATLVMLTNQYLFNEFNTGDVARLGAQVINGIGFLGAGTIVVTQHQQVKGLTTAAGLWASACMGLAIGIGFYEGAIMGCFFLLLIVIVMNRLDERVMSNSNVLEVFCEMEEGAHLSVLLSYFTDHGVQITHMEIVKRRDEALKGSAALLTLRLPKSFNHEDVLGGLNYIEGLAYIEEV